ncbi:ABC transporter permease [bacterium]|nr:ABC transporter permease [bacterium]
MGPLSSMVRKEFLQLRRDRAMMRMILMVPVIQLMILAYAINTDLRNVRVSVLDQDGTPLTRRLIAAVMETDVFIPGPAPATPAALERQMERGETDLAIHVPRGFTRALAEGRRGELGISVDGTNSSLAGRAAGDVQAAIMQEARRLGGGADIARIEAVTRFLYNPELESRHYMVPGILVMLVTIIAAFITGMAVVREKEIGTLEQVMVTPLGAGQFVAGKLIPFALIALLDLAIALGVALLWFHVPFRGPLPVLLLGTAGYLAVTLGIGLLASAVSGTQQQAMFSVWFYLVFAVLLSGFFFPVENMPTWARLLTWLDPMRFYMSVVRGVLLKGAGLVDLARDLIVLGVMGVLGLGIAVLSFRKTSA